MPAYTMLSKVIMAVSITELIIDSYSMYKLNKNKRQIKIDKEILKDIVKFIAIIAALYIGLHYIYDYILHTESVLLIGFWVIVMIIGYLLKKLENFAIINYISKGNGFDEKMQKKKKKIMEDEGYIVYQRKVATLDVFDDYKIKELRINNVEYDILKGIYRIKGKEYSEKVVELYIDENNIKVQDLTDNDIEMLDMLDIR
jgi:DNA integrity scanning protein DisA with diadenylate cyclase activity